MIHLSDIVLVWSFDSYSVYDNGHGGYWLFHKGILYGTALTLDEAQNDIISRCADDYYLSLAVNRW